MSQTVTIQLKKAIKSATVLATSSLGPVTGNSNELEKDNLMKLCQVLQNAAKKANEFHETIFKEHREQIAKLSVEIARKILVKEIEKGKYDIEAIINEALKSVPTRKELVVYMHQDDFAMCQKLQQDKSSSLADITFVGDSNIGRGECIVESAKGRISSLINEHLTQIEEALTKVE